MPNWKTYESSVRLLAAIIAAHPGLKLNYEETAKYYGDGAGYKTIWSRCAKIKETAQAFRDAVTEGIDPHTVSIDEAAKGSPLKTKGANAIAKKYGEGVTAKAISTRFERLKKEPHANLDNSFDQNEATPKSARVRGTPKSGGRKASSIKMDSFSTVDNMTQGTSEDDEDELYQSFPSTPSKKPSINKVQSGRIMKSKPLPRSGQVGGVTTPYIVDDDNEAIKAELSGFNISGANLADPYQEEEHNMNMVSYSHTRMDMGSMGIGNGMGLGMMMGSHQYVDYDDEHEA